MSIGAWYDEVIATAAPQLRAPATTRGNCSDSGGVLHATAALTRSHGIDESAIYSDCPHPKSLIMRRRRAA